MMTIDNLSREDYFAINEKAAEFIKEFAARGVTKIAEVDINSIIGSIGGLPDAGQQVMYFSLMFPDDAEFISKYEELGKDPMRVAQYYGRNITDVIGNVTMINKYASFNITKGMGPELLGLEKAASVDDINKIESDSYSLMGKLVQSYQSQQARTKTLREKNAELRAEIENLNATVEAKDRKIADLESQLGMYRCTVINMHGALKENEMRIAQLLADDELEDTMEPDSLAEAPEEGQARARG